MIGIAGFLIVAVIATGVWWVATPVGNTFAQEPTPTTQPDQTTTTKTGWAAYRDYFLQAFASRLGVTVDKLKEAYSGAFGDTVDQAVKDGKLTQAQADQMKTDETNRLNQGDLPGFGPFGGHGFGGRRGFGMEGFWGGRGKLDLASFAKALNMTEADLSSELQSGKTLADVVKEKNADLAQVKTSVLNDLKAKLDQAVTDGKLTQTNADEIYNQASTNFDTMVNQAWPMHPFKDWMH